MDDLAAAASVARRTLRNQFASKEDIYPTYRIVAAAIAVLYVVLLFREMLLRVPGRLEDAFPPGIKTKATRRTCAVYSRSFFSGPQAAAPIRKPTQCSMYWINPGRCSTGWRTKPGAEMRVQFAYHLFSFPSALSLTG
jgi:hypothetical protein